MDSDESTQVSGLDRRTLLKRSVAVGGALVWTTPVVQSFAGPAFAAGEGSPACVFYLVRYRRSSGTKVVVHAYRCQASSDCCGCLDSAARGCFTTGSACHATSRCVEIAVDAIPAGARVVPIN